MQPLISVLIPTFNRPESLGKALASAYFLGPDVEVIIGNNGDIEPVCGVIGADWNDFPVEHLRNPKGSTYPDNLKILIERARGKWLTVLHDDDFFTEEANVIPRLFSNIDDLDFVFSDHWIADDLGTILPPRSIDNSMHYGRNQLAAGPVMNLQLAAVNQTICMDCFFVKAELAKRCSIHTRLKVFADILLLAQIATQSRLAFYIPDRIFAYRLSGEGITASGIPQDELLNVLKLTRSIFSDRAALIASDKRIRCQALNSLKYSIKRGKFQAILHAVWTLFHFS